MLWQLKYMSQCYLNIVRAPAFTTTLVCSRHQLLSVWKNVLSNLNLPSKIPFHLKNDTLLLWPPLNTGKRCWHYLSPSFMYLNEITIPLSDHLSTSPENKPRQCNLGVTEYSYPGNILLNLLWILQHNCIIQKVWWPELDNTPSMANQCFIKL